MSDFSRITDFLKYYDGPAVRLMEICGTHTASIAGSGIRSMLSPRIKLVSGPGCPVCVSSASYIDALCALSLKEEHCVYSFGDMMRVPGSKGNLSDAMAEGGRVEMLYSPYELLKIAARNPHTTYVFAAVGFETTAPVYALMVEKALRSGIGNIRLLTSLKTMPPVMDWLCDQNPDISGFIAPGHVSVITGTGMYIPLARRSGVPFAVTGFEPGEILESIYLLIRKQGQGEVFNLYTSAVKPEGNELAREKISQYFEAGDASWRGLGRIKNSGLYLRHGYDDFDAGSRDLMDASEPETLCHCKEILTGRMQPVQCPLFGNACTPRNPVGACMVSAEGTCRIWMEN